MADRTTSPTPLPGPSNKALIAWLAAASTTIFLIGAVATGLIFLPEHGVTGATLRGLLFGGSIGACALLALWCDAMRRSPD